MNRFEQIRQFSHQICADSHFLYSEKNLDKLCAVLLERRYTSAIGLSTPLVTKTSLSSELLFGAVNYSFVNPHTGHEYTYIAHGKVFERSRALKHVFDTLPEAWLSDFKQIGQINNKIWTELLAISDREYELYDCEARRRSLNTFLKYLINNQVSNGLEFVQKCSDAASMCRFLLESRCFDDPFLKRVQATIVSIHKTLVALGENGVRDIKTLTGLADYRVPQVLMNFKVIIPPQHVLDLIESQTPVPKNSPEEIALRAWSIIIIDRIATKLDINAVEADKLVWDLSQDLIKERKLSLGHLRIITNCY